MPAGLEPDLRDLEAQLEAARRQGRLRRGLAPALRIPHPFVRGIRFSLATGLHVIAAHERRHLWQAWRVRRALEGG